MSRTALALGVAVALLAARAARADSLTRADGQTIAGSLEEITVLCDGTPGLYARKAIASIEVGDDASVVVALASGAKRAGKLVTVRFRALDAIVTVPGNSVAAIKLEDDIAKKALDTILEEAAGKTKDTEKPEPDPEAEALARSKKALARNLSLRNAYWDRAVDLKKADIKALKAKRMGECRRVAQEIQRHQQTIERKERQRREAERRWREAERRWRESRQDGKRGHRRRPQRPVHDDGLDNDIKKLREAEQKKRELQREIAAAMKQIADKASLRKRRVEATYARQRRALGAGEEVPAERITANYKAALGEGDGDKGQTRKPKPRDGKRKKNDAPDREASKNKQKADKGGKD